MKNVISLCTLMGGLLLTPYLAQAQSPDTVQLWRIELVNENEYIGTIISRDAEKIVFDSRELGVITIRVKDVRKMEKISPAKFIEGEFWFENPQAARYFWAPNGYGLKRGESYYQNVWIFFNQFSFGITDHVSMGLGIIPVFLFEGGATPVWITPKVSIPIRDKLNLGGGALIGTILGEYSDGAFGIAYGTATYGSKDRNINMGLGYGFAGGEWGNSPTVLLSGMYRVSKRGYVLTENYWIDAGDENVVLLSFGGRSVLKKVSIDYGAVLPALTGENIWVIVPWLGIVIPVGQGTRKAHAN